MAPIAVQALSTKVKRPIPPGIQTNGINSSTSSPSPSMSAGRLPGSGAKNAPGSATSNGVGVSNSNVRSANRVRREPPAQLLGRGQRNSSVGLRSGSIAGEMIAAQVAGPQPYIKTDEYILKKFRGYPPSLVIHLHAGHFRFDQHEGSFSYKSPMKIMIEHLRTRTIPHDLVDFFAISNVPYYEDCMIVQVYNHKSTTPSQDSNRVKTGTGKTTPFSVHNYNAYLTPSPYVAYSADNQGGTVKAAPVRESEDANKSKTSEQKDKENMPAPSFPIDGQRARSVAQSQKPKLSTIVLHPTASSDYADFVGRAADARSGNLDARELRQDVSAGGPLSATVPPTPMTAIPSTPITSMAPPAKRLKRSRVGLDNNSLYALESQILLNTTAPLNLEPVSSASEYAALLESLSHPMHVEKPPSPKTRKRTVAELAADEALAADQERFMLILDERLSNTAGVQGGANPVDGDGQAGGASFEPRFERFKTMENIRIQHEENKKVEKARQQEADRKSQQDRDRERMKAETEKKEREALAQKQQLAQQAAANQQNEANRQRAAVMAARSQQQGLPGQAQNQHSHPQSNGVMANGIQSQPRFHQQQGSQAQVSSPIVRNNTPQNLQNHSSPMGNIPMQHSTSSMGGSPARPGSVVPQTHPQMGSGHGMTNQRSQQSHAGTPRMPSATPNLQSTPLNRPMNQTPRMSQASPLQGAITQPPNAQMIPNNAAASNFEQQRVMQQRMITQRAMQQMQNPNMQAMNGMGGMNGQALTQQQQQLLHQQQMMRAQANPIPNTNQIAQTYAASLATMGPRPGGMAPNMGFNMNGNQNLAMQQYQLQQMQQQMQHQAHVQQQHQHQVQAQVNAQVQAQAQAQAQSQHQQTMSTQQMQNQQLFTNTVRQQAHHIFQNQLQQHQAQYQGNVPEHIVHGLRQAATESARVIVTQRMQQRNRQMMGASGMQPNGMQNGMGMQRPQGM